MATNDQIVASFNQFVSALATDQNSQDAAVTAVDAVATSARAVALTAQGDVNNLSTNFNATTPTANVSARASTVANAVTALRATPTAANSAVPNSAQRTLYIPSGLTDPGVDTTITTNGAGQTVRGDGESSRLVRTGLEFGPFSNQGVFDLFLSGTGTYGVKMTGEVASRSRYNKLSNVTVRDKTYGYFFGMEGGDPNKSGLGDVLGVNLVGHGGQYPLYIEECNNLYITNGHFKNGSLGAKMFGLGEFKGTALSFQGTTGGYNCEIVGTNALPSLESYFVNCHFNQGSATDAVAITSITSHSGGSRILVQLAGPSEVSPGYAKFIIAGNAYAGTHAVYDVINSANQVVLNTPYVADATGGTFNRYFAGLFLNGEAGLSMNDFYFTNGAVNEMRIKNTFNAVFNWRGMGAKEKVWLEGENNRLLFFGSARGRSAAPFGDVYPSGPSSHTGNAMIGVWDDTALTAPGSMYTGIKAPFKTAGVGENNRPMGYAFSLVYEDRLRFGIGSGVGPSASNDFYQITRASLSAGLILEGPGLRVRSGTANVNGVDILGGNTGAGVAISAYGGDANIGLTIQGKGTGNSRLRSGDGTDKVLWSNTGLGFFGSAAVAKQTITGSRASGAALTDLLTKLAALGLITDGTSA